MQELGIIRKMEDNGRVVIPAEVRREMKWDHYTPLELFYDQGGVLLRTYEKSCTFCDSKDTVQLFENKPICQSCIDRLKKI
ncbi:MAG: AbrB family transcriptional regulator [Ruminococcaceae bacterium]|nr:AbrB family transcriptional regulator [Oscillospiraceae bacterium]